MWASCLSQPSKNDHPTKTIIVHKTGDHYDACLPRLSTRAKSVDQRLVTTLPLAEGSCNNMQSHDKLGAKVDHDSGVLSDMNCTPTIQTSGGLLQFLNILTYISYFKANENIFMNFNYDFTKGDKSFLKELNDFRIKHAKNLITYHLNVNGIRSKFAEVTDILTNNNADIFS